MQTTRDEEGDAPGNESRRPDLTMYELENKRHYQLGGTAAHIAPPSCSAIGETNDISTKHGAHPVLATHKSREREADDKGIGTLKISISKWYQWEGQVILTQKELFKFIEGIHLVILLRIKSRC